MDAQELLTAPASTLTRRQRKDRAALKRQMARNLNLPPGYALGEARGVVGEPPARQAMKAHGNRIFIPLSAPGQ